jgi:hypothetical protein
VHAQQSKESQGCETTAEDYCGAEIPSPTKSQEKVRWLVTWYAAHLLFYVKLKKKRQKRYPIWENIVLIQAKTEEEAFAKAEQRARDDACMCPDESFTWGGEPAEWVFGGVRKLMLCMDEHKRPGNGTEVTYSEWQAPSWQALQQLIHGRPVSIRIDDGIPDDESTARVETASSNGRKDRLS